VGVKGKAKEVGATDSDNKWGSGNDSDNSASDISVPVFANSTGSESDDWYVGGFGSVERLALRKRRNYQYRNPYRNVDVARLGGQSKPDAGGDESVEDEWDEDSTDIGVERRRGRRDAERRGAESRGVSGDGESEGETIILDMGDDNGELYLFAMIDWVSLSYDVCQFLDPIG
jgi:hypothetical protein